MSGDDNNKEDGLDRSLKVLLSRAYEPVDYRQEFRDDLLDKLKSKQREMAGTKKKRGNTIRLFKYFTGLAAAAAFIFTIAPMVTPQTKTAGDPTIAGSDSSAKEPTIAAVPSMKKTLFGNEDARIDEKIHSVTDNAQAVQVKFGGNDWQTIDSDADVQFCNKMQLKVNDKHPDNVMLALADGAYLTVSPGSKVCNDGGKLKIDDGKVRLKLAETAKPLTVALPQYNIQLNPGADIAFKVESGNEYADGGAPAPYVAVFNGTATAMGSNNVKSDLTAGNGYDMFPSLLAVVPGHKLGEIRRRALGEDQGQDYYFADTFNKKRIHSAGVGSDSGDNFRIKISPSAIQLDRRIFLILPQGIVDTSYKMGDKKVNITPDSDEFRTIIESSPELGMALKGRKIHMIVKHDGVAYDVVTNK
ncbi:MAG: hypothetical protein JXR97_15435 [Planctomycetes bacterium]|nr:hypothetical protein [Planctomycetota bacterium]